MAVSPHDAWQLLSRRESVRARRASQRAGHLTRRLAEAAKLLRSRFGAKEVWLFGSLAWGGVRPESDVDIAVSGFCSDRYFEALAELAGVFGAPVDLVEIERAPASLRELIESQGRRL